MVRKLRDRAAAQRLCLIGVTTGGISTLGLAVLLASNCEGLRNIELQQLVSLRQLVGGKITLSAGVMAACGPSTNSTEPPYFKPPGQMVAGARLPDIERLIF